MAAPALLHAQLLAEQGADLAIPAEPGSERLWANAQSAFAPLVTLVLGAAGWMPLLEGRTAGEAYLCHHDSCELPARSIEALQQQLALQLPNCTVLSCPSGTDSATLGRQTYR